MKTVLKTTGIFLLLICVMTGSFMLGGLSNKQSPRAQGEEIPGVSLSKSIRQEEKQQFSEREGDFSSDDFRLLYNLYDMPEFLLVETGEEGYEIYHRETGKLLEKSEKGNPYLDAEKAYYLGPGGYIEEVNSKLIDIQTKETLSSDEKNQAKEKMRSISRNMVLDATSIDKSKVNDKTAYASLPDLDITTVKYTNLNDNKFDHVPAYTGTIELWTNPARDYSQNKHGSCVAVSMALMLRYLDAYNDAGVIPEEANGNIPASWKTYCSGKTVEDYDNPTISESLDITSSDNSYVALTKYLIALSGVSRYGISDAQKTTAFNSYNSQLPCVNLSSTRQQKNTQNDMYNYIKSTIAGDKLVSVSIFTARENNIYTGNHSAVAYGAYYDFYDQDAQYLKIHTGWSQDNSLLIISSNFLQLSTYMYVYSVASSSHNMTSNAAGHSCSNGCYAYGNSHYYYENDSASYSGHVCVCGKVGEHGYNGLDHDYYNHQCFGCEQLYKHENVINEDRHDCTICEASYAHCFVSFEQYGHMCMECLESESHNFSSGYYLIRAAGHSRWCWDCTSEVIYEHDYTSIVNNGNGTHSIECEECGYADGSEAHVMGYKYYNASKHVSACMVCSYTNPGFLNLGLKNHTYEKGFLGLYYECSGCGHRKSGL